jgi:hypothetical protein
LKKRKNETCFTNTKKMKKKPKKNKDYWYHIYYIYLFVQKSTIYVLIPLHTHSIYFHYIYDTIYTLFEIVLIPLCIWYQNFERP